MERGFFVLLRVRGTAVRLHWSAPLGALAFTLFRFHPWAWAGFFLVVLWHEAGHALVARAFGFRVLDVAVHAGGGLCRWAGPATPLQRALVSWGGIAAQALLLAGALGAGAILGEPTSDFGRQAREAFVQVNAGVAALNLLPVRPLDGASAWALVPLLAARARDGMRARWHRAAQRRRLKRLHSRDELEGNPDAFAAEAKEMLRRIREEAAGAPSVPPEPVDPARKPPPR